VAVVGLLAAAQSTAISTGFGAAGAGIGAAY